MKKSLNLIILLFLLLFTHNAMAQQHDYPAYPKTDLAFEHLEGSLEINEQMQIRGDVTYSVRFRIGVTDSLQLDAERMQVSDVLVNERTMDYEFSEGKLTIFIDEEFNRNDTGLIRVVYSTEPVFGFLKNYGGTMFTSQVPLSTSHWLPVLDHPGITMTTDLRVTHPSSRTLVMTGRQTENAVTSVEQEETRFVSQFPVPVTSLFFAIGAFQTESRTIENIRYHIYTEQPNSIDTDNYELINLASETIRKMEDLTSMEYPFGDLHIVMLQDLMWENRTFAAGTVLTDVSLPLEDQIKFGIAGQWAGVMLREMQWSQPEAIQLLMGYFATQLDLDPVLHDSMQDWDTLYKALSADHTDRYGYYLENEEQLNSILAESLSLLYEQREYPFSWSDLSRVIYRNTGQPYFDKPEFTQPEITEEKIYYYNVEIDHVEEESEVIIRFEAVDDALEELVAVQVKQFTFNETQERELTFTGATDEIVLTVPASIENLVLSLDQREDIRLETQKPFMFWIYQLRNGETVSQRREAAAGLRSYSDNPDVQLALLDIIEMEPAEEVYTEIVRTLSHVTNGASGTSQLFLDRTGSGQPESVRIEAVRALAAYTENDGVISRLQSIIRAAESKKIREEAILSLAATTDLDRFTTITESMIIQESVLDEVPLFLENLAVKGGEEQAVRFSETFLSSEFPYAVRSRVLKLILDLDESQRGWENRIENLLTDNDPRIRFLSVGGLQYLSGDKKSELIDIRRAEEFDVRVYREIENVR